MSIEVVLIAIIVGLLVFHILRIRDHREGHRTWREIALHNSKKYEELSGVLDLAIRQKSGLAKIIVDQNKLLAKLARQCKHGEVTATEDGGKCNACGVEMIFDHDTIEWIAASKTQEIANGK